MYLAGSESCILYHNLSDFNNGIAWMKYDYVSARIKKFFLQAFEAVLFPTH